jgi:hypothetical protein
MLVSETHSKRHATQHHCLPSLLGDKDKLIGIVYGDENKILYWAEQQPRQDKNLLYLHQPNEPTIEGHLFESLFVSVSTVSRGQLSSLTGWPIVVGA